MREESTTTNRFNRLLRRQISVTNSFAEASRCHKHNPRSLCTYIQALSPRADAADVCFSNDCPSVGLRGTERKIRGRIFWMNQNASGQTRKPKKHFALCISSIRRTMGEDTVKRLKRPCYSSDSPHALLLNPTIQPQETKERDFCYRFSVRTLGPLSLPSSSDKAKREGDRPRLLPCEVHGNGE